MTDPSEARDDTVRQEVQVQTKQCCRKPYQHPYDAPQILKETPVGTKISSATSIKQCRERGTQRHHAPNPQPPPPHIVRTCFKYFTLSKEKNNHEHRRYRLKSNDLK